MTSFDLFYLPFRQVRSFHKKCKKYDNSLTITFHMKQAYCFSSQQHRFLKDNFVARKFDFPAHQRRNRVTVPCKFRMHRCDVSHVCGADKYVRRVCNVRRSMLNDVCCKVLSKNMMNQLKTQNRQYILIHQIKFQVDLGCQSFQI